MSVFQIVIVASKREFSCWPSTSWKTLYRSEDADQTEYGIEDESLRTVYGRAHLL